MFHSRGGIFHSFSDRFKIKAKLGDLLMRWEQGCLETGSSRRGTTPNIGNFAERAIGTVCGKGFITPPMHGEGRSTVGISMSRCHLRRRRLSLTLARCCSVDSGARVALIAGGRKVRLIDVFHSGKGRLHHSAPLTGQSPKTSLGHPEWESRRTAPGNGKSAAERPQRVGRAVPNLRNGWFA